MVFSITDTKEESLLITKLLDKLQGLLLFYNLLPPMLSMDTWGAK
jgi:hypothetical protein